MKRIFILFGFLLAFLPGLASASHAYHPSWTKCFQHLDRATATRVVAHQCSTFTLRHEQRHPISERRWIVQKSPHVRIAYRFPQFTTPAPAGYWVWVITTGYDQTGLTATGSLAGYGSIAVDPSVFPYGTRFFIPGYGYGTAVDTGAFSGAHLDVWFSTEAQCFAFTGFRRVEVLG